MCTDALLHYSVAVPAHVGRCYVYSVIIDVNVECCFKLIFQVSAVVLPADFLRVLGLQKSATTHPTEEIDLAAVIHAMISVKFYMYFNVVFICYKKILH